MSRILLADDSPHAQRMGEFILREEGFEVVSVTDGQTALVRLPDVDPDVVLADVSLPSKNGYEICHAVKSNPRHIHAKVVLTAGAMEPIDEAEATRVQADGNLRKPFEATAMLQMIKQLVEAARQARQTATVTAAAAEDDVPKPPEQESVPMPAASPAETASESLAETPAPSMEPDDESAVQEPIAVESLTVETIVFEGVQATTGPDVPEALEAQDQVPPSLPRWEIDPQAVRAAVTLALEAALPVLIDEVTQRVITALSDQENRPLSAEVTESAAAG